MAARASLFSLLKDDTELAFEEVYPTNAVDTPQEDYFAIITWGPTTKAYGTTGSDRVSIWVHDRQQDYGRINNALQRLKELLPATVHLAGGDGWVLSTAEWNGESQDLSDEGYGTITRYADFTVVSRYASA